MCVGMCGDVWGCVGLWIAVVEQARQRLGQGLKPEGPSPVREEIRILHTLLQVKKSMFGIC